LLISTVKKYGSAGRNSPTIRKATESNCPTKTENLMAQPVMHFDMLVSILNQEVLNFLHPRLKYY